jgi:hypothetical protein
VTFAEYTIGKKRSSTNINTSAKKKTNSTVKEDTSYVHEWFVYKLGLNNNLVWDCDIESGFNMQLAHL